MTTPLSGTTPTPAADLGSLYQSQITGLGQARDLLSQQVGQANLLQPGMFNLAGVTPKEGGGYNVAPTEANPQLTAQWDTAQQNLSETLRKQLGPGWQTSTPGYQAMSDFQTKRIQALESDRRTYESQRLGEIMGINQFPTAPAVQMVPSLVSGLNSITNQLRLQQMADLQAESEKDRISAANTQAIFGGLGNLLGQSVGRGGGISGTISDIFGIPGAVLGGVSNLGKLFGFSDGSATAAGAGQAATAAGQQGGGGISGAIGDIMGIPGSIYSGVKSLGGLFGGTAAAGAGLAGANVGAGLTPAAVEAMTGLSAGAGTGMTVGAGAGAGAGAATGAAGGGTLSGLAAGAPAFGAFLLPAAMGLSAGLANQKLSDAEFRQKQSLQAIMSQNPQIGQTLSQNWANEIARAIQAGAKELNYANVVQGTGLPVDAGLGQILSGENPYAQEWGKWNAYQRGPDLGYGFDPISGWARSSLFEPR